MSCPMCKVISDAGSTLLCTTHALEAAEARIAKLEREMHTYSDQCGCPWCDTVRRLHREKQAQSDRVVELTRERDYSQECGRQKHVENARLREALKSIAHCDVPGCWCQHSGPSREAKKALQSRQDNQELERVAPVSDRGDDGVATLNPPIQSSTTVQEINIDASTSDADGGSTGQCSDEHRPKPVASGSSCRPHASTTTAQALDEKLANATMPELEAMFFPKDKKQPEPVCRNGGAHEWVNRFLSPWCMKCGEKYLKSGESGDK